MSASIWEGSSTIVSTANADNTFKSQRFVATQGQTVFTITAFAYQINTASIEVFINGGAQFGGGTDFTETDNTTITLTNGAQVGDIVVVRGFVGGTSAQSAAASASQAATSASNAATSATNAASSATSASTSATNAANSATSAAASAANAAAMLGTKYDKAGGTISGTVIVQNPGNIQGGLSTTASTFDIDAIGANSIRLNTNSSNRAIVDASGNILINTSLSGGRLTVNATGSQNTMQLKGKDSSSSAPEIYLFRTSSGASAGNGPAVQFDDSTAANNRMIQCGSGNLQFYRYNGSAWVEDARLDTAGSLLLLGGAASGNHNIAKLVAEGNLILGMDNGSQITARFFATGALGSNGAATAVVIGKNSSTSRSINAGGTVNASGADYAEYMVKSANCGTVTAGQIVGITGEGKLTDKWAESISFLIKSTNPSYVGGDTWGTEEALGVIKPTEPQFVPPSYSGSSPPGEFSEISPMPHSGESQEDYAVRVAAYNAAFQANIQANAQYTADQVAYQNIIAQAKQEFNIGPYAAYLQALADFNTALEAARQRVDRIAFCGQVPVNVINAQVGQYLVPVQNGVGIGCIAVDRNLLTFSQYLISVGVVQNILPDGRANVRVKVA